jgi:hypothetical protein
MKSLRMVAFAAVLAAVAPAGAADERPMVSPEALATARELFTVTFERAGVEFNAQAVELAWPSLENALRGRNPAIDAATMADLRREFERIRLHKMRELAKDAPAIYARYLSQDEMREIITFYRTPTGTKLMRIVPPLTAEIFAIVLPGIPAVVSDTHEEFLRLARERGVIK